MQKQMLIYYCYCNDYTNDINSRMIIRKSRLILNRQKRYKLIYNAKFKL